MADVKTLKFKVDSTDLIRAEKSLDSVGKAGARVEKSSGAIGKSMSSAGKASRTAGDTIDKSMRRASTGMTTLSTGTTVLFRSVTRLMPLLAGGLGLTALAGGASQFADALAEVSTLVDTATFDMAALSEEALNQSRAYGSMPVATAKAYYQAISAGASTAAEATDVMNTAQMLAVGGVTDIGTAVDGLTTVMNAYGDKAGTATDIADAMFVGMKAGKTTIGELSNSIGKIAPLAEKAGASFDEVIAATAALSKGGIDTSVAMNGLRAIMAAVMKPTKEAADLANELGIEFNAAGMEAMGFARFMEHVMEETEGSSEHMALLFGGVEALVPAFALTGKSSADFAAILGQTGDKAGAMREAFEKMVNSPGFQSQRIIASLSAGFTDLGLSISQGSVPALKLIADTIPIIFDAIEGAADIASTAFDSVTDAFTMLANTVSRSTAFEFLATTFDKLGPVLSPVADYIIAFGTAILGLKGGIIVVTALGAAITAAITIIGGLAKVALATNPLLLAISAVAAAAYLIYDNWNPIKEWWGRLWDSIGSRFDVFRRVFENSAGKLDSIFDGFIKAGNALLTFYKELFDDLSDMWTRHFPEIERVVDAGWALITSAFDVAWTSITNAVETGIALVLGVLDAGMKLLSGNFSGAWDAIIETTVEFGQNMLRSIAEIIPLMINLGKSIIAGLWVGIKAGVGVAKNIVSGIADSIIGLFKSKDGFDSRSPSIRMFPIGEDIIAGIGVGMENGIGALGSTVADLSDVVVGEFQLMTDAVVVQSGKFELASTATTTLTETTKDLTDAEIAVKAATDLAVEARKQQIQALERVTDEISRLEKQQLLQNIALTDGADAARYAELLMNKYSDAQARNAIETENNMALQKAFYDTLVDSITNADSIKDVFTDMGRWMAGWLKEQIAKFAAQKIMLLIGADVTGAMSTIQSFFSGIGGFGGSGSASGNATGTPDPSRGGAGMAMLPAASAESGALGAAGTAVAYTGLAVAAYEFGQIIGSQFKKGAWEGVGNGFDIGREAGETIGRAWTQQYRDGGWFSSSDYRTVFSELDKEVLNYFDDFVTNIASNMRSQFEWLGQQMITITDTDFFSIGNPVQVPGGDPANLGQNPGFGMSGGGTSGQNTSTIPIADYVEAVINRALENVDMRSFDNTDQFEGWLENIGLQAYNNITDVLSQPLQDYVNEIVNWDIASVEDVSGVFDDLAKSAGVLTPMMQALGLTLGSTFDASVVSVARLAEQLGGMDAAIEKFTYFIENIVPEELRSDAILAPFNTAIAQFNTNMGLTGAAAVASTDDLWALYQSYNDTNDASGKFRAAIIEIAPAFAALADAADQAEQRLFSVTDGFAVLGVQFDPMSVGAQALADSLIQGAGGIEAFNRGVTDLFGAMYDSADQAAINLGAAAMGLQGVSEQSEALGLGSIKTRDDLINVVNALDITNPAHERFLQILQLLSPSLSAVFDSGKGVNDILGELDPQMASTAQALFDVSEGGRELAQGGLKDTADGIGSITDAASNFTEPASKVFGAFDRMAGGADAAQISFSDASDAMNQSAGTIYDAAVIFGQAMGLTNEQMGNVTQSSGVASTSLDTLAGAAANTASPLGSSTASLLTLTNAADAANGPAVTYAGSIQGLSGTMVAGQGATSNLTGAMRDLSGTAGSTQNPINNVASSLGGLSQSSSGAYSPVGGLSSAISGLGNSAGAPIGRLNTLGNALRGLAGNAISALKAARGAASQAQSYANQASASKMVDGSYASGLPVVKRDGLVAELHKGETVMPLNVMSFLRSSGIPMSSGAANESGAALLSEMRMFRNELSELRRDSAEHARATNTTLVSIDNSSARQLDKFDELSLEQKLAGKRTALAISKR